MSLHVEGLILSRLPQAKLCCCCCALSGKQSVVYRCSKDRRGICK